MFSYVYVRIFKIMCISKNRYNFKRDLETGTFISATLLFADMDKVLRHSCEKTLAVDGAFVFSDERFKTTMLLLVLSTGEYMNMLLAAGIAPTESIATYTDFFGVVTDNSDAFR
jgi:hypothetical protein